MSVRVKLVDVRQTEVSGDAQVLTTIIKRDGTRAQSEVVHSPTTPVAITPAADWEAVEFKVRHPNYVTLSLRIALQPDGTFSWNDPCSRVDRQGADATLAIPLSRIQYAPGQLPTFGPTTGGEKGVVVNQGQGRPQTYAGLGGVLLPVEHLRLLEDITGSDGRPQCILNPHDPDGWRRLSTTEVSSLDLTKKGGFLWLEYGSIDVTRLNEPRFLIALWAPDPAAVVKDDAVDMLVFFSPSTATTFYPVSRYPFRDQYPYQAHKDVSVDPETGEKHPAKVQPYVVLGSKYLFTPTFLAAQSIASEKPPLIVMPIFPHVHPKQQGHVWQPFRSKAGLHRLLLEICQFLQRESYNSTSFGFSRWNGAVAPIAGAEPPPFRPAYTQVNRKQLAIRQIIVSGYSSASTGLIKLLKEDSISASTGEYPAELFAADHAEFDKRWQEFWTLDFNLDPKRTGVKIQEYEKLLLAWLSRDSRRLRIYHSGWTTGNVEPSKFYPQLRKALTVPPRLMQTKAEPERWGEEWRDPSGRWSALFFSSSFLWSESPSRVPVEKEVKVPQGMITKVAFENIVPQYPVEVVSVKGKPPVRVPAGAIHPFTLALGFGHASKLRKV
ncbi:hypothetical protein ACPMJQ_29345 [Streptomyces pseudogriseolus]|uniref:hypothetical protein n=1 Tax=Streptomyces pseudogriseolus TaxID=36817 RepID=UPI003FA2E558